MLCIYICERLTLCALLAKVCNTVMPSSLIARKVRKSSGEHCTLVSLCKPDNLNRNAGKQMR